MPPPSSQLLPPSATAPSHPYHHFCHHLHHQAGFSVCPSRPTPRSSLPALYSRKLIHADFIHRLPRPLISSWEWTLENPQENEGSWQLLPWLSPFWGLGLEWWHSSAEGHSSHQMALSHCWRPPGLEMALSLTLRLWGGTGNDYSLLLVLGGLFIPECFLLIPPHTVVSGLVIKLPLATVGCDLDFLPGLWPSSQFSVPESCQTLCNPME